MLKSLLFIGLRLRLSKPIVQALTVVMVVTSLSGCRSTVEVSVADKTAMNYLIEIADKNKGIGAREAGSRKEIKAGKWIKKTLSELGYKVTEQPFEYVSRVSGSSAVQRSNNYIIEKKGTTDKTIVITAHYDSVGQGSLGAADNGTGVAVAIAVAKNIKDLDIPWNVRFVWVGAEETGLNGSIHYVKTALDNGELEQVIGMVNLDTVAGGDFVYVNASYPYAPEDRLSCEALGFNPPNYTTETAVRDALVQTSMVIPGVSEYNVHPSYEVLAEYRSAAVSDYFGFACVGIPVASVESTNYDIQGINGYDGYSQTTNPALWDCYDAEAKTACSPSSESKWGEIWHSNFDTLAHLQKHFPGRIEQQLQNSVEIVTAFLTAGADFKSK